MPGRTDFEALVDRLNIYKASSDNNDHNNEKPSSRNPSANSSFADGSRATAGTVKNADSTAKTSLSAGSSKHVSTEQLGAMPDQTASAASQADTDAATSTYTVIASRKAQNKGKGKSTEDRPGQPFNDNAPGKPNSGDKGKESAHVAETLRNWETNLVASRGDCEQERLSKTKQLIHSIRTIGERTLPLKKAIRNALKIGIVLRDYANVLIAIGVEKGWLDRSMQGIDISPELVQSMQRKIEAHYRQPRKGKFDQCTFCRLIRVVSWMVAEIKDDLLALKQSYGSEDSNRGVSFRIHFAADWSEPPPVLFEMFEFSLNTKAGLADPLGTLCHGKLEARISKNTRKRWQTGQSKTTSEMNSSNAERIATAFASFWFAGIHIHTVTRREREEHTVFRKQPGPYEDTKSLQKLHPQKRSELRQRCLVINDAVIENVRLLNSELSNHLKLLRSELSKRRRLALQKLNEEARLASCAGPSSTTFRSPSKVGHRDTATRGASTELLADEWWKVKRALNCVQGISGALQKDRQDIQGLFHRDNATKRDLNILLFYSSLRSHAWNCGWYGCERVNIVEEIHNDPEKVLEKALNVSFPAPEECT